MPIRHRPLADVNGSFVVRQALSPALPKKIKKLFELKPSGAPLAAEREIGLHQLYDWAAGSSAVGVACAR